jgi:chemotaxis protein CheX
MIQMLLAEDESNCLQELQAAAQVAGVKITLAKDGLEAFRKVRVQKFDVIVLREALPKISGLQLTNAIRELENNGKTQIFIYSDNPEDSAIKFKKYSEVRLFKRGGKSPELNEYLKTITSPSKKEELSLAAIRVDVRIVNQFVEATEYSMKMFGGCQNIQALPVEAMGQSEEHLSKIQISGAIAILSTMFAGSVLICFPKETFLKVVTNVFGDEQTEINKDNSDATGELINIIYGQAKTVLVDDLDIDFMKSRSYAVEGQEKIKSYQTSASFLVPFESELGPFYLIVSFDTIKENRLAA